VVDDERWRTLADATAVNGGGGSYEGHLSEAWQSAVGPFGGYLAAIVLRAAAAETTKAQPVSLSCHFLAVGGPGPIAVDVRSGHATRRAESLLVSIRQADTVLVSALAWFADAGAGIDHPPTDVPVASPPVLLAPIEQLHKNFSGFWFAEARPIYEPSLAMTSPRRDPPWTLNDLEHLVDARDPSLRVWGRIRPDATFDDPAVDAARAPVLLDWFIPFLAATRYAGRRVVLHSTLDLVVHFHAAAPTSEWLYCEAHAGPAAGGVAHGHGSLWSEDGVLVATAAQQMLQRVRL
jgi:acyl-CoA thioesterase II